MGSRAICSYQPSRKVCTFGAPTTRRSHSARHTAHSSLELWSQTLERTRYGTSRRPRYSSGTANALKTLSGLRNAHWIAWRRVAKLLNQVHNVTTVDLIHSYLG